MILLIDNYDSFTYNLYQYLAELGADVVVRRNDAISVSHVTELAPDGIVISPGPCTPRQAGICVPLIRELAGQVPILGICLGHQAIADAFGGRIVRAPRLMHGKTSSIYHDGRGVFAGLPSPFVATRYHSLIAEEESLPERLEISARSEDGLIMGLRDHSGLVEGVQFHPESILTEAGKDLLRNFLSLVEAHRQTRQAVAIARTGGSG